MATELEKSEYTIKPCFYYFLGGGGGGAGVRVGSPLSVGRFFRYLLVAIIFQV